jgi:uncharacterized protein YndB with AHSA1/START domain
MGILAWMAFGVVVALAAFLIYAWTRPSTFALTRSAHIDAPPARVYSFIDDFRQWALWSPWEKMDAELERRYSGAARGVGAVYEWQGAKTGQGRMEITDVAPAFRVGLDLDFIKPFKAHNKVIFKIDDDAGGSRVTWSMSGNQGLAGKMMSVFMSMDKMVGGQFDEGLANMKRVSEAA